MYTQMNDNNGAMQALTGCEGLDSTDFSIPYVKLVQNTSKIKGLPDATPGGFVDATSSIELGKAIEMVVLKVTKFRTLFFDMKKDGKNGVRCRSNDGITPNQSIENPVSATCAGCDQALRDLNYRLMCLDVKRSKELGEPVVFEYAVHGTALDPIKRFINAVRSRRKGLRDFSFILKAAKADTGKGSYYVPAIEQVTPLDAKSEMGVMAHLAFATYATAPAAVAAAIPPDAPAMEEDTDAIPF